MQETFGKRFQRLRKEKGLTQEDIANKFDISAQAVSKWENDISYPDITILNDLSNILGVTTDELLGNVKNTDIITQRTDKKDPKDMLLRIIINSSDGTKVRVNLPITLIKLGLQSEFNISGKNNDALNNIDFEQVIAMAEQGLVGKLVEITDEDGTTVEIFVE